MPKDAPLAQWIAVDWGTSNLRVWAMDAQSNPVAEATSDKGMGQLTQDQFEPALLDLIEPYLDPARITPVLCAGMVGARQGWVEAAYQTTPCHPAQASAATVVLPKDPRISVHILPGVSQAKPPDVMRGEETQIAGVLREDPDFDGVLCLPGTHTKWVRISAGEIVSFQTVMTGELFGLLSDHSVLKHSLTGDGWNAASFTQGVADAMDRPQAITAALFGIRAAGLVNDMPNDQARARLSGLLIGIELAATKPYWLGQNVGILGADTLAQNYTSGLSAQGVPVHTLDARDLTLKGLISAYNSLQGATA
jgi:2-dehydro-3-deoxygalactonokinase